MFLVVRQWVQYIIFLTTKSNVAMPGIPYMFSAMKLIYIYTDPAAPQSCNYNQYLE